MIQQPQKPIATRPIQVTRQLSIRKCVLLTTTPKIPNNGDDSWACYKKFQTEIPMARCPTEIYTIQVTTVDEETGSKRTIESKYSVACH